MACFALCLGDDGSCRLCAISFRQVDHIPSSMRSNYAVSTFFEHLFPNSIKKVRRDMALRLVLLTCWLAARGSSGVCVWDEESGRVR
jgi:hypothetical protein